MRRLVHGTDHFGLGEGRTAAGRDQAIHLGRPRLRSRGDRRPVAGRGRVAGQAGREFFERHSGIGDDRDRGVLEGVEFADVDGDETHVGMRKRRLRHRREVAQARADGDHEVGFGGELVGRLPAGGADRAEIARVIPRQGALAGLGFTHGDAGGLDEVSQRLGGLAVEHAAAGDQERLPAGPNRRRRALERGGIAPWPLNVPVTVLEQRRRIVVRLGLRVFGHRQRDRAGVGRGGEHPHHVGQRRHQLLGPGDAIPVLRDRPETIVHRDVLRVARLRAVAAPGPAPGSRRHRRGAAAPAIG